MDDWVRGSKEICKYFGFNTWPDCREWLQRNKFPLMRLPAGQPVICKSLVHEFILNYNKSIGLYDDSHHIPTKTPTDSI
jgi:hypothetical protein